MSEGTYENEIQPIRGDIFLDKILGWLSFACGVPVLGFSIAKQMGHLPDGVLPGPGWLEPARIVLISLGLFSIFLCTLSKVNAFKIAIAITAIRILGVLALWPYSTSRYAGSELLFDFVILGYAWIRIKKLSENED